MGQIQRDTEDWSHQGLGEGELLFNGYRVSVWDDEKVWNIDCGADCSDNVHVFNAAELYT